MDAPALPQDAADLLAIGRRYFDVRVEWVPPGGPGAWGRTFGFWRAEAGPPGWEAERAARRQQALSAYAPSEGSGAPACCEWTDARQTIWQALHMARRNWPERCAQRRH